MHCFPVLLPGSVIVFTEPSFSGTGYLALDAVQYINNNQKTDIDFEFRATHGDGTLFVLTQVSLSKCFLACCKNGLHDLKENLHPLVHSTFPSEWF